MITDEEWQAIKTNDATYDSKFRYAVKTTKIFCRPSCHSRLPKRENVEVFYHLDDPINHGYRPCKRCRPTDAFVSNEEWTQEIETILQNNYQQNLTLEELAYLSHGSESHLRHVFKKVTNKTPQQRLTEIRLDVAKHMLVTTDKPVEKIAMEVGLANVSYFIQRFKHSFHESPKQYRKQHQKTGC
ncbi:bifunctional transcriptional activator/DNA repair enzyme AdaA [Enterococcus camelliae]|uniref:Bifunctional transcriptional activator/DNA repair enzyme AdaA n=1 Tax=Enterococcus camelliae TaxID=453959 RepID=A0ABW5THV9_9ENTE